MLISDHRVPMVLRRRCLYDGKPSPRRLTKCGQCGLAGGRGVWHESKRAAKVWRTIVFKGKTPGRYINAHDSSRRKSAHRTVPGEVANQAPASQGPTPGPEREASARREPDAPPTEDADILSATRSEVESAMNHRRHRIVLRDACFSPEALNAFNAGDMHLRAAQDGLTKATEQYVKDIRVRNFNGYICQ